MAYIDITDPNYNHLGNLSAKIPAVKSFLGQGFLIMGGFPRDIFDKKTNPSAAFRDIDVFIKKPSTPFDQFVFRIFQNGAQAIDANIQMSTRYQNPLDVVRATYLLHNMFFIPFLDQPTMTANGLTEGNLYTVSNDCITAMTNREIVVNQFFKDDFDLGLTSFTPEFGFYFISLNKYLKKYKSRNYKLSSDTKAYFQTLADRLEQKIPASDEQLHFIQQMFITLFSVMGIDYRNYLNSPYPLVKEAALKFQEDLPAFVNAGLICYEPYPT